VKETFQSADSYSFQFWAPVVSGAQSNGPLIRGLDALSSHFEEETGESLEPIINKSYTSRIDDLCDEAEGDVSDYGSPAFRFLQILKNLQ